ncbi:MAG: MotA/TolQ/ExbB proton channel family protein [Planctomycetota bacterium]
MWQSIQNATGAFFYPQLALSLIVTGLVLGHLISLARGEGRGRTDAPWRRSLDPLAGLAVSLGLLGSVFSFAQAFRGFGGTIDIDLITTQLGVAYSTTAFGLVTSIIAALGSYLLDVINKTPTVRAATGDA